MANAPRRRPSEGRPATSVEDLSNAGGRGDCDPRDVQRPSGGAAALETFEQNVERGTNDARLRQDVPATPDSRGSDPD